MMSQKEKVSVFLIGGQSNALGCSPNLKSDCDFISKNVSLFQDGAYSTKNNLDNSVKNKLVNVSYGLGYDKNHFGLEVGFAKYLEKIRLHKKVIFVKYACDGTYLNCEWASPGSGNSGRCYDGFCEHTFKALELLKKMNYDYSVEGFAWMQGCSDAIKYESAVNYRQNINLFIQDVRKDLQLPDLKIAVGVIKKDYSIMPYYDFVACAQKTLEGKENIVVVETDDLTKLSDKWHYDSFSELELGIRFAKSLI